MGCNDGGYVGTMDNEMWRRYKNKEVEKTYGRVQRIERTWHGINLFLNDLHAKPIKDPVRLECRVENEFELIPWQHALLGYQISYERSVRMTNSKYSELAEVTKIRFYSGPLINHEYQEPSERMLSKE